MEDIETHLEACTTATRHCFGRGKLDYKGTRRCGVPPCWIRQPGLEESLFRVEAFLERECKQNLSDRTGLH